MPYGVTDHNKLSADPIYIITFFLKKCLPVQREAPGLSPMLQAAAEWGFHRNFENVYYNSDKVYFVKTVSPAQYSCRSRV